MKPIKRIILLFLTALCGTVCAQTYDTIGGKDGKLPHYFYPNGWFDTCLSYLEGCLKLGYEGSHSVGPNSYGHPYWMAIEYRVDEPVAFVGVTVMVKDFYGQGDSIINDTVYPDTVSVICRDSLGALNVVASVSTHWDTAPRRVLKIPLSADSLTYGFDYAFLYDLKFDQPVVVDSVYYLLGTQWNVTWWINGPYEYWNSYPYGHITIAPACLRPQPIIPGEWYYPVCDSSQIRFWAYMNGDKIVMDSTPVDPRGFWDYWGPYLLMIDSCTIEVESADSAMGTAGPTRSMSKWVTQTITATPEYGYRFSHWDDGNTDNPRDVYLTQDTHFTAYFERTPRHMVQTRCVPEGMGLVRGGGQYWSGDTVTLTATGAIAPYIFHEWNDGSQENPRCFVIEQDTLFTAYFGHEFEGIDTLADAEALFTLTPNPTTGDCLLETRGGLPSHANCRVSVTDAQGREVLRRELKAGMRTLTLDVSNLPAGTYFVTLTTKEGTSTRKLVVE
jgi:hypothetical protein